MTARECPLENYSGECTGSGYACVPDQGPNCKALLNAYHAGEADCFVAFVKMLTETGALTEEQANVFYLKYERKSYFLQLP